MTLHIYSDITQGGDEWLQARCGVLTASQIGKLLTSTGKLADNETSRTLTETLVAERLTGVVDYVHPSFDMQRGSLDESYARDFYAEQFGVQVEEVGFATLTIDRRMKLGASPDGLIGKTGGLEIKSRRPKAHLRTILTDTIPAENLAQIHCCMLVLERHWWDYVSYAGNYPLYVKRVRRDPQWDDLLLSALERFEATAEHMIGTYRMVTAGQPVAPFIDHFAEIEIP